MFLLSNGNLLVPDKVAFFERNRRAIFAAALRPGPVLYKVYADRIARNWP